MSRDLGCDWLDILFDVQNFRIIRVAGLCELQV